MKQIKLGNVPEFSHSMKESLRALKTNIQFCGDDVKVIMVTSTSPDEGKSTVCFDLACSLTESGKRVLLIDSDMRKSVLVGRLRAKSDGEKEILGLSHFLSGQKLLEDIIYTTDINRLYMIFAGPSVPNPTEILEKKYFAKLVELGRDEFDYVIIDCAPIGAAIDAVVVAKHCDGAILVIEHGVTGKRLVMSVKKQLEKSGVRILGAVLNKVKLDRKYMGYGKYYGDYYGHYYGNYYGGEDSGK